MQQITTTDLARLGSETRLIDVREPDEFERGHVPWAVNIPLAQVAERLAEIQADGPVHLICQAGGRSAKAAEYLDQQGYDTVNVEGGTGAWIADGSPVDTGA